jgi:hypothetical protein
MTMGTAPDTPHPVTPLEHAHAYAAAGIRVLPIKPGEKRPPMASWQHAASTDTKIINNWFNGLYTTHGVGLAMGPQPDGRWLFALDIDEHDPAASGSDTLAELEQIHGPLPDTVRSITGSGGAHHLFVAPAGVEVANGAAGAVGPGIDIRGAGGQIVVAPTIHPNGRPYSWEDGRAPWEWPIADAPAWLVEMVASMPRAVYPPPGVLSQNPSVDTTRADSPADHLRQSFDWYSELTKRGWQHHHTDRNGDSHWTRPGKDPREGTSAVLHGADGPFTVFTTDASAQPMWRAGKVGNGVVSLSPLAYVAAYDHGGDLSAASRALRATMGPQIDVTTLTAPGDAPVTTLRDTVLAQLIDWPEFWSADHTSEEWIAWPLIPAHRQVALFAPAKTGKSIVTLAVLAAVATGRPVLGGETKPAVDVLYLDYEMTAGDLQERLEALGYSAADDLSHFHYALLPSLPPLNSREGSVALCALADAVDAQVVVIDTMGRAVDGEENDSSSYRDFARTTGLALKAAGRAVLRTDHAGKEKDRGQRGSSAKNDDVDVVIRVDATEGGWTLTRTHSRVAWVPEKVAISKNEGDDGSINMTVDQGKRTYLPNTKELAETLKGLGVTSANSRREAADALRAAGQKASNRRVTDALAWLRAEEPVFGSTVTVVPKPSGTTSGTTIPAPSGTTPGTSGDPAQNPRSDHGDHESGPRGPEASPSGDQDPPLEGVQDPPVVPDALKFDISTLEDPFG